MERLSGTAPLPTSAELQKFFTSEELKFLAFKHGFAGILGAHEPKPKFSEAVSKLFKSGRLCVPNPKVREEGGEGGGGEGGEAILCSLSLAIGGSSSDAPPLSCQEFKGKTDVDLDDSGEEEGGVGAHTSWRAAAAAAAAAGGAASASATAPTIISSSKKRPIPNGWIVEEVPEEEVIADLLVGRVLRVCPPLTKVLLEGLTYGERREQCAELAEKCGGIDAMEEEAAGRAKAGGGGGGNGGGAGGGNGTSGTGSGRPPPPSHTKAAKPRRDPPPPPKPQDSGVGRREVGVQWSPRGGGGGDLEEP